MKVSEAVEQYNVTVSGDAAAALSVDQEIRGSYPDYTGPLTVTPTQQTQILPTAETGLQDNITIEPIPSNYGLITWNGTVLLVS